jgi:hypothetical protein
LVMDAGATGDKGRVGRGRIEGGAASKPLGTGRTNSGSSRGGNHGLHRAQAILRGMESKQAESPLWDLHHFVSTDSLPARPHQTPTEVSRAS